MKQLQPILWYESAFARRDEEKPK